MKIYSNLITEETQTQPIFGRTDMVKNNAGGYVFSVSDLDVLKRFLLLGAEGGTYYTGEMKLVKENATSIVELIKKDGPAVVSEAVNSLLNRSAPKSDPALFVLALAASYGSPETKKLVYDSISKVVTTATHLFTFVANIQALRGWSRGLRTGVARWYTSKTAQSIAYQIVKYRQRNGYTHRDVIRLSHPKTVNSEINSLLKYAVGKAEYSEVGNSLINTFGMAQNAKTAKELIPLIKSDKLTWEMVPTELLNEPKVLEALVDFMPLTALLRNLNRFSYNGLTKGNSTVVKKITARFSNVEEVKKAKLHPINIINSMKTYEQGRGDKGSKTWDTNQNILDAMSELYELSVSSVVPTNKNILVAADVSGSMQHVVSGMSMSASQIAQVLSVTILKTEKNAEMINFDTKLSDSSFGRRSSIDQVLKHAPHGGGTDCSLPLLYALHTKKHLDAIIILTDNETWAGNTHAATALASYRANINKDVKVIEVALVSNPYTQFPSDDKNVLRVVGFDSSVVELINKFIE